MDSFDETYLHTVMKQLDEQPSRARRPLHRQVPTIQNIQKTVIDKDTVVVDVVLQRKVLVIRT